MCMKDEYIVGHVELLVELNNIASWFQEWRQVYQIIGGDHERWGQWEALSVLLILDFHVQTAHLGPGTATAQRQLLRRRKF